MTFLIITYSDFNYLHGQNIRCFYFIKELLKNNHKVHLIVTKKANQYHINKIFSKKIIIHKFNLDLSRFNKFKLLRYGIFFLIIPLFIKNIIKKITPQVIYAQNLLSGYPTSIISKNKKIIFIYDIFDLYYDFFRLKTNLNKKNLLIKILKYLEIKTLQKADMIFTISKYFVKHLKQITKTNLNIKLIYEGTDFKLFHPKPKVHKLIKKYKITPNEKIITFIGGIEKHDGLDIVLKSALKLNKDKHKIRFLFVGKGTYLQTLKNKVHKYRLHNYFIFTGWIPYKEIKNYLSITDICILPLLNSESTRVIVTTKLYEYLACKKAVIAPNLPGIRDVINNRYNGLLYNSENENDFLKKLIFLLNNPSLIKKYSQNGYKLIKTNFNIEEKSRQMLNAVKNMIYKTL